MSTNADLSLTEKQAYDLIVAEGGLLQSQLWKELDVSSRTGSRLATALEEKGLLSREQTTKKGQRTYLLEPTNGHATTPSETASEYAEEEVKDGPDTALTARETRALALIRERGGLYQSEFWKELGVNSRTGSRLATGLEAKELIRREETTYNGQRTYLLLPAKKELDFSVLMAGDMFSPLVGTEEIDPITSDAFAQWILQLAYEEDSNA